MSIDEIRAAHESDKAAWESNDDIGEYADFVERALAHKAELLALYDAQAKELAEAKAKAKAAPETAWLITSRDSSFDTFVKYSEPLDAKLKTWYPGGYHAKPLKVMP